MEKNKEVDQGEFYLERFPPILPRPATNVLTSTTTSSTRKRTMKKLRSTAKLAKPEIMASSCSLVTSSRSGQAPLASTSYSQVPIMVVNPIQHQKSSVESVTSSTQTISTCAPSNTGTVTSSGISSTDSSLQFLAQGQSENTFVQGGFQNYGVVLGNSLPAILPGSFVPNQLIQPSPFLGSVFIPPSIQGNALQGNLAQGFNISGGLLPVNQFHFGIQNAPQFSSCLQQVPVMNPGISLPVSSIQNSQVVKEISTTVSAATQSSFKFVVEPDPEFDKKMKDATIVKDTNVLKESCLQTGSAIRTKSPKEKPKEDPANKEEKLPKIESCYSMKKLSLKEMMVILNEGHNVLTFVKPGTNDYYRAKILCEAVVKYHITKLHSDIDDSFFTSLVSPYISLSEALHLRSEIKHVTKEEEKQKGTGVVSLAKDSAGVIKATGKETAEHILRWKTEKLENFNPELYQQFSARAKNLQSTCSLTRNDTEVSGKEINQKRVNTNVNLSEPNMNKKARKSKTHETNTFLESNMISNTKASQTELMQKNSGRVSDSVTESEQKLIRKTCTVMNEQGKASEADLIKKAFNKETFENNRSEKIDVQKKVVSQSDVGGITPKVKLLESDAKVLKDSYRQQIFEKDEISKISKESKFSSNGHSERKKNSKETLSEAELIRKAFTLSGIRSTVQRPLSPNHVPASQARESLHVSEDVNKHNANKSQNQCFLNVFGEEIVVIKSEPDEDIEDLNALALCESEKNSDYTGFRCSDDESVSSAAPSRKYTLNSENVLIPTEPVEDIATESSVELSAFEEREKSEPCVPNRRHKSLPETNTKNALSSDSGKDMRDDAAEKGQASSVEEITGSIHLPNEFMLGKWSQNILSINQKFSGETANTKSCCYLCGVLFPSERVVWSHILYEHTSANLNSPAIEYPNYICTHCFQNIGFLSLAQKHEVDIHLCEYPCYFCGLSLDDSFTMLSHVATVHSRLFTCEICQGQFLGKWEFQKHCSSEDHKQSNSDISKVVLMCLFCNCKFDSEMALAQHLTNKHIGKAIPNSRECVCQSCRHSFLDAHALQNHRSPDARKVDKHRPVCTTSLVKLAAQVIETKKTVDLLRKTKQKKSAISHCMLVDLIRKDTASNDNGYREVDFNQRKYVYPFEKLLKYCELDSDIAEEAAMLIMDKLMKFILCQYPLLQLDTGRKDFHNLVVAVSRSQRFTQLLRSLKFKPLAWTTNVKKYVKMFLEKVQASCYRNADFTQLCESLQKSLNFLEESKNPVEQKLPSLTLGYPLTNNFEVLTLKHQNEGNDGLPPSRKTGTVDVAAQAKQKTTQPSHSKAMQVTTFQSDRPKGLYIPSMSTVSTCTSSTAALPGFSTQDTSTSYQLVQVGMNYVFVPVGQTTIPVSPAVQNVTIKGITGENKPSIYSDLAVNQSTVSNSLPATDGHPQCSAQKMLNVQSECNLVTLEEGKKKIVNEHSSSNILSDRSKEALKKFVAIAPKAGAPPTNKSKKVLRTTGTLVSEMIRKKIQSSSIGTDSRDVHAKEETDSFVESSALLKQWFVKVKKPMNVHNETKLWPNLNENEDRPNQKSRKLVVNNHLKRLANKKKGFQIADRYRAHTSKNSREILIRWMFKASGNRQEKKRRGAKKKKLKLEQSHDHILRKRKPVSYRYEDEMLSDSDDEKPQSSSANNTESDEEWKPSDEESEEEFCDGMIMKNNLNSNGENNNVVVHGGEGYLDFTEEQNKNDFEQTCKNTVLHSGKVRNTRDEFIRNGSVMIDQKELQKDILIEPECDNPSCHSKKQESMPVSEKFSKTFMKDDTSPENTKHLTERKAAVGKFSNLHRVNLKRYAPSLGEEYIPPKILKVSNSAASLNSCTKKTPWLSDLSQFLKCCFVRMERCDQADRLGVELLVVCIKDYCERKLTRNFVKQICREDQDRTKNKILPQNDLNINDKTDDKKKEDVTKAKNASSEKKTTSITIAVRGRGRPRKNMNIVEATSATEERLQETVVNEDTNALSTERCCTTLERRRGRSKKKVNNSGDNSKIEKHLHKTEEEEFNERSDNSFSVAGKKLRPRKNLNYFEEDSSDKRESDDSNHNAILNESDTHEFEECKAGLLGKNSSCHKTEKANNVSRETVRISSSKCTSFEDPSEEEEIKASFNHVRFSKPDSRDSPRPDLINLTNKDNVSLTAIKNSQTDIADVVAKEASRIIKKECLMSEDMNEVNGREVFSRSFVKVSDLVVEICPKPDLLNVTNQEDIDLSACKIDLSNSTFNETGTDYIPEGAKRLFGEEGKVSTETEKSMSEQAEEMETNLTILPIHIKQEVDLSDDVSDSIGIPLEEKNTSNMMKTVSKSFQNPDIQSFCKSVSLKKRNDIISHQLPSSSQTTSCMSSLVSQASSKFSTLTSSAYTKQVKEASPHSSRKPEIGKRSKDSKQAVSSEPTQAKVYKENPMQIVNRYPVLFYPKRNSAATSGVSSASPGSAALRAPPPLVMMSTTKSSQTNTQPTALQTPSLETSGSNSLNVQMLSKDLSSLGTLVKNVGENQTQTQTPVPQSAVYFVPVSGTNQFIPVNILNSVVQTGQLQQTVQTQQTNQFQQTGNIQQAPMIQGTPQIGLMPFTNFSNMTLNPVQLPSFPQTSQQQVITSLQTNSQFLQTDVQTSAFQGLVLKQSKHESESTSKNHGPDHRIEPSEEKSSQLQQSVKKEFSEEERNKQSAVVQQQCHALPQHGTNQNVILQNLPLAQSVAHIQGLQLPLIQTGQVQMQGLQPAFGMGMLPNQLQGLNQSGLAVQGFQVSQTGVQTLGNANQTQQQKIRMISPQGTSHTLMVNQQTPLAPGQLIYVPNTTGSDTIYSGHVIGSQTGNNAMQSVPPVVNAQSEDTGNKMETMSESLNKQEVASSSQAGRKPEHGGDVINALQTGVEAGVEKTQAQEGATGISYNEGEVALDEGKAQIKSQTCKICSRSFFDPETFTSHFKWHSDGKYACFECKLFFQDKFDIVLHKALKHCKKFVCKVCSKTSPSMDNALTHILSKHNYIHHRYNLKENILLRFSCYVCGSAFEQERKLRIHLKVHFGGFFCDVCGNQFENEDTLENHFITKHGKCYVCKECSQNFDTQDKVLQHISDCHTDLYSFAPQEKLFSMYYTCKTCDKKFNMIKGEDYAYFHFKYEHSYDNCVAEEGADWCD